MLRTVMLHACSILIFKMIFSKKWMPDKVIANSGNLRTCGHNCSFDFCTHFWWFGSPAFTLSRVPVLLVTLRFIKGWARKVSGMDTWHCELPSGHYCWSAVRRGRLQLLRILAITMQTIISTNYYRLHAGLWNCVLGQWVHDFRVPPKDLDGRAIYLNLFYDAPSDRQWKMIWKCNTPITRATLTSRKYATHNYVFLWYPWAGRYG